MEDLEFDIDGELFRVERRQPTGAVSYDFAWLNGPDDGEYGFTVGLSTAGSDSAAQMTEEQLIHEAREFVEGFFEPGGIGEEDFPGHTPARSRRSNKE